MVADEVRKLAEKTSKSAISIRELIEKIVEETKSSLQGTEEARKVIMKNSEYAEELKKSFEEMGQSFEELTSLVSKESNAIEEQSMVIRNVTSNTHNLLSGIENVEKIVVENYNIIQESTSQGEKVFELLKSIKPGIYSEIYQRVIDHAKFMQRVIHTVEGKDNFAVTDHTQCAFGKWYYNQDTKTFLDKCRTMAPDAIKSYNDVENPHREYHRIGMEIQRLQRENKHEEVYNKIVNLINYSPNIIQSISSLAESLKEC